MSEDITKTSSSNISFSDIDGHITWTNIEDGVRNQVTNNVSGDIKLNKKLWKKWILYFKIQ